MVRRCHSLGLGLIYSPAIITQLSLIRRQVNPISLSLFLSFFFGLLDFLLAASPGVVIADIKSAPIPSAASTTRLLSNPSITIQSPLIHHSIQLSYLHQMNFPSDEAKSITSITHRIVFPPQIHQFISDDYSLTFFKKCCRIFPLEIEPKTTRVNQRHAATSPSRGRAHSDRHRLESAGLHPTLDTRFAPRGMRPLRPSLTRLGAGFYPTRPQALCPSEDEATPPVTDSHRPGSIRPRPPCPSEEEAGATVTGSSGSGRLGRVVWAGSSGAAPRRNTVRHNSVQFHFYQHCINSSHVCVCISVCKSWLQTQNSAQK